MVADALEWSGGNFHTQSTFLKGDPSWIEEVGKTGEIKLESDAIQI